MVASAPVPGYRVFCSRARFSSSLCDRTMLRRPSICHLTHREEGCSSTAINRPPREGDKCWNNPANRSLFIPLPGGPVGGACEPSALQDEQ